VLQLTAERSNSEVMINNLRKQIASGVFDREQSERMLQNDLKTLRQQFADLQRSSQEMRDSNDENPFESNSVLKETLIQQA
jgi:hypothetical protein